MVPQARFLSLLRTADLEVVRIDAEYDAPYEGNDHEVKPSISFVQQGVFRYTAGRNSTWLHGGAVLVERGDVEYTVTKPKGQRSDSTLSVRLLSDAAQEMVHLDRGRDFRTLRRPATLEVGLRQLSQRIAQEPAWAMEAAVIELLEQVRVEDDTALSPNDPHVLRLIDRARELMHAGYASDLRLRDMAGAACISPFHFNRLFKRSMGITPYRYLLHVRVAEAKRLLREGMTSSECAYACGFGSPSHFTNAFRAATGVAPGVFAKSNILQVRA